MHDTSHAEDARLDRPTVVPFVVHVHRDGDRAVLAPRGELDLATVAPLAQRIRELVEDGVTTLVFDASGLTFIDSTGLRLLLETDARAREDGRRFLIVDGDGPLRRLLAATGLTGRFEHANR